MFVDLMLFLVIGENIDGLELVLFIYNFCYFNMLWLCYEKKCNLLWVLLVVGDVYISVDLVLGLGMSLVFKEVWEM